MEFRLREPFAARPAAATRPITARRTAAATRQAATRRTVAATWRTVAATWQVHSWDHGCSAARRTAQRNRELAAGLSDRQDVVGLDRHGGGALDQQEQAGAPLLEQVRDRRLAAVAGCEDLHHGRERAVRGSCRNRALEETLNGGQDLVVPTPHLRHQCAESGPNVVERIDGSVEQRRVAHANLFPCVTSKRKSKIEFAQCHFYAVIHTKLGSLYPKPWSGAFSSFRPTCRDSS